MNTTNPFLRKLSQQPLLADGAMGTILYTRGASSEQCLEELVLSRPGWVTEIHQAYASAGADIIRSHTFGANRLRLARHGLADKVRAINFGAVKLVRDVREIAGRSLFIAGNVGPLGVQPALSANEMEDIFREQMSVLWEAGADLLQMESFIYLDELLAAVETAKKLCDLTILASMTYAQDGLTQEGLLPGEVTEQVLAAGADIIGVNCSVGPSQMWRTVQLIHATAPDAAISVMPNAGFPERIEGRLYYPSSPEYFGEHVPQFLAKNARILGGCCGTTPIHIRTMRQALDAALQDDTQLLDVGDAEIRLADDELPDMLSHDVDSKTTATGLLQKIQAGKFVVSVEVDPPRGFVADKQVEGARHAKAMGADAVNVADSPMARVRMGALALCTQIQQQVDIETVLHFTTRDRSLMGLQADLIGAHALGVRNILALTGDPPSLGDQSGSTPVYDVDSIGLVRIIGQFNQGVDLSGKKMGQPGGFTIAVACDPTRPNLTEEVDRFHQKVSGGAHFTMSQPIYDPQLWVDFLERYEERHGAFPAPVMIGILPLQSHRHASFLHNEVPGITLSEAALHRMEQAGKQGREEGVKMAQELLLALKEQRYVQGVYLMPSFGRYELACQVLDVL
ncbi:MAG: bifunctional homocysteine S-methyltransferase/methylenetetrahydrofolate reductase [Chloroflexota bacterium]